MKMSPQCGLNQENCEDSAAQLYAFSKSGNISAVRQLLDSGVEVDARGGPSKRTALCAAVEGHNESIVKLLLDRGADINAEGNIWVTALYVALLTSTDSIIELLLDRGADINAQNKHFNSAFLLAATKRGEWIVKSLLNRRVKINSEDLDQALQEAAMRAGGETMVLLLLEYGANLNAQGGYYSNALQAAAAFSSRSRVQLLLDCGADVNAEGGCYGTALQAAAAGVTAKLEPQESKVELLLDYGANVNSRGGIFGTALQAAVAVQASTAAEKTSKELTTKLLLDHGADVNDQVGKFGSPLFASVLAGDVAVIQLLLSYGADASSSATGPDRSSLLHNAVMSGSFSALEIVLEKGAKFAINSQNDRGQTPLYLAIRDERTDMVQLLLQNGARGDAKDFMGTSLLQIAVGVGNRKTVSLLYQSAGDTRKLVNASAWRDFFDPEGRCDLELLEGHERSTIDITDSKSRFSTMAYPLSPLSISETSDSENHFLKQDQKAKRMFILKDGRTLRPQSPFKSYYRWWCLLSETKKGLPALDIFSPPDTNWYWRVQSEDVPTVSTVRSKPPDSCFLECCIFVTCLELSTDGSTGKSLEGVKTLQATERGQGVFWIMVKRESLEAPADKDYLFPVIFVHTTELSRMPDSVLDIISQLVIDTQAISCRNIALLDERLINMRAAVLKSAGSSPELIHQLIKDAQMLDDIKANYQRQRDTLHEFQTHYMRDECRSVHEDKTIEAVKTRISKMQDMMDKFDIKFGREIAHLSDSSKNLIQLEFNLTSIREAQKSTSTNRSLKRLSWITFVFLPPLFVASLFGMNIDVLADNPPWWWYWPFALGITGLTFAGWLFFKLNNRLDGPESRFAWIIGKRHETDLERGKAEAEEVELSTFDEKSS